MIALHTRVAALDQTREAFEGRAFAWGSTDCSQFVLAFLRAAGAQDVPLGAYDTELGALRALRALGADSLFEAVDDRFERIDVARALPGDLVAFEADGEGALNSIALGLVRDRLTAFAFGPDGLTTFPMRTALLAWRAG